MCVLMRYIRSRTSTFSRFFFFNDTATTEIYTLSLHDALPIWNGPARHGRAERPLGTEVDDREWDVGAGGGHHGIRRGQLLVVMDDGRHALGDRDRAGRPHPTRGRLRRRAPRLAGERRGGGPGLGPLPGP